MRASNPLFAGLTGDERSQIGACLHDVSVEAGTSLTRQGENAWQLFVIEDGHAEVRKGGEVVASLGPGDFFGEIGLLATGTRTATVVATSPMRLAVMFLREFNQLERRTPALARTLRDKMAERGLTSF